MTTANAGELALALQTARGTAAAASTQRTALVGGRLSPAFALAASPELRAGRGTGKPWVPRVPGSGDLTFVARPKMLGLLLYAALGAKSVSGSSDPWTHTFTPAAVLPWMTAWAHFGGTLDERFVDCRLSRLVISSSGGYVTVAVTVLAGSPASRTAQETTVAVETADVLYHRHGASALLLEGVAYSAISSWALTIDCGVQLVQGLGGPLPRMAGMPAVSMDIVHIVPDAALWKRAVYGSASPSNLTAPVTAPLTLAGSPAGVQFTLTAATGPERSLKLAIPNVALGPSQMPLQTRYGPIVATTQLVGYAPVGGAALITATLKNGQSSY